MPSKKDLIQEHEKLIPILREGSQKERDKEADEQEKELAEMQKEEIVFAKNGQWTLVKSSYGPKSANLYDPVVNIPRKQTRTGEVVEGSGKNVGVREYTSSREGTAKEQAKALASKQAKLNVKQPVKTEISPELKAELENKANLPKSTKIL